jgi:uncharacterized membrane protein
LGCVFIAVPLAVFAPEHFHGGPSYIQNMAPSWMPVHWFWPYFVGFALLAAATSLTVRRFVRLSSSLLGLMFFLFVCLIYIPSALANAKDRLAWALLLRDLSFAGGAWALAGLQSRASSPRQSKWMILFGRIVITMGAIFFAIQHFLHPEFAPGVPLKMMTPSWVPFPSVWGYLAGAILLAAGIGLALNRQSRIAAASIGALMTALTLFLYLPILILADGGSEINQALNSAFDTLLYAGTALVLASALPRDPDRVESGRSGVWRWGADGHSSSTEPGPRFTAVDISADSVAQANQTTDARSLPMCGSSSSGSRVSTLGLCGFEQTRPRRRLHQEDVHSDDRARWRIRD